MGDLTELSILFAQRAGELERARGIFVDDSRSFVEAVLARLQRQDNELYSKERVRLTLPQDVECEGKPGYITDQNAVAIVNIEFKRRKRFVTVAEFRFGIVYDSKNARYAWTATCTPTDTYPMIDNALWRALQGGELRQGFAAAEHIEKTNTIRFFQREIVSEFSMDAVIADIQKLLDFFVASTSHLSEVVGVEEV